MSRPAVRVQVATPRQVKAMLGNATVAYVLAQMLVIVLHESAHALAGLVQGYQATQYTGEVRFAPEQSSSALILTALAGPVFSLSSGLVAMRIRPFGGRGFAQLLWIWLAFLSAEEGFGYLIIAPTVPVGDTGTVLTELHAPSWVGWVVMVVGIGGLVFLAQQFAGRVARHCRDFFEFRAWCFQSWILGTFVTVALQAAFLALTPGTSAGAVVAIMIGAASLGLFAPMAMMFRPGAINGAEQLALGVPLGGILAAAFLALVNLLVLTHGVVLG
jgi:hypothetical protein